MGRTEVASAKEAIMCQMSVGIVNACVDMSWTQ
jgi:hypothetical protein